MSKSSLKMARTSLLLRQKDLAEKAGVSEITIIRAERGDAIQLLTAQAILIALNRVRQERKLAELDLGDLDWNVS